MTGRTRKLAGLCLALMLLLGALPLGAGASGTVGGYAFVVNTSSLNLRSGPGLDYAIIGSAGRNEMVQVLDNTDAGSWRSVMILPSGPVGFMDGSYLSAAPQLVAPAPVVPQPSPMMPVQQYPGTLRAVVKNPVSTQFLNLREYPSYNARVLGIYYNGTQFNVLGESSGWYHVQMDSGLRGYFRSEFVSFDLSVIPPVSGGRIGTARVVSSGGRVNLRQGPGYQYKVLASYYPGKQVDVYTNNGAFWQISVDGLMGYMDRNFLYTTSSGGSTQPGGTNARVRSGAHLNLRQQPNLSAKVLGQYPGGTAVNVRRQGTEWSYVTVPSSGKTGYFMTRYLTLSGLPEIPTKVVKHPQGTYVNLRGQPNTRGTITTRVPHNSVVTVLAPMGDWTKVKFGVTTGYMMSAFLK